MPQIIDLQLFQAAQATTQPAWAALQGKFEQSQDFFNQGIAAREQASQALGEALKPVFSASGSVISGGIQNVMGGKSFFPEGTLFGPAAQQAAGPFVGPPAPPSAGTMSMSPLLPPQPQYNPLGGTWSSPRPGWA